MQSPSSIDAFLALIDKSGLLPKQTLAGLHRIIHESNDAPKTPEELADLLVGQGVLTTFQTEKLLSGKFRGFFIGKKYKLLQRIGRGGMGAVYLCEHLVMKRRVALKVLPVVDSDDPDAVERFHQEAQAVASLDHPNIVRAHDVDLADNVHFLVMEYVDGANLYAMVKQHGPLSPLRAAHYIRQAALGLQHAHEAGIVHRDIKPGNLLVDRNGVVKILDLGLVRFFHAPREAVYGDMETGQALGTPDYLAPEQTFDSRVDIRADIYSLGVSFYYLLTGQNLFPKGTPAQKLIWHQVRIPRPVRDLAPDVSEEMTDVLDQMLAKDPDDRYQTPAEVADALEPLTKEPIPPPSEEELPKPIRSAPVEAPGTSTPISRQSLSPVSKIRVKKNSATDEHR